MSYTTKGIAAIQENAKKLMGNKFSYELYIDDDEDQGENHAVRLDLAIQEELETFDREYNSESGANVLKKNAQDAFNQLANHLQGTDSRGNAFCSFWNHPHCHQFGKLFCNGWNLVEVSIRDLFG